MIAGQLSLEYTVTVPHFFRAFLPTIVLVLSFKCLPLHAAQTPDHSLKIHQISGAAHVSVKRGQTMLTAQKGAALILGDEVTTGKGVFLVLMSTAGNVSLTVHENSIYQITENEQSERAGYLREGKIVGEVKRNPVDSRQRKYRFSVQTRAAVMGVRGTVFEVEESQVTRFHIIEGVVDIAQSTKDLLTENFVVVKSGQLIEASLDLTYQQMGEVAQGAKSATHAVTGTVSDGMSHLSAAMPFDVMAFISSANSALPEFLHLPFLTGKERTYSEAVNRYHLSSFEIFSQKLEESFAWGLSWNPTFHVTPGRFDLRGHLGFAKTAGFEAKLLGTFIKKALFVEAGPAYRSYSGLGSGVGANLNTGVYYGDQKLLHLIDRFIFGVSWISRPSAGSSAWDFRFGLGITLF